jgi:hypothetical protein
VEVEAAGAAEGAVVAAEGMAAVAGAAVESNSTTKRAESNSTTKRAGNNSATQRAENNNSALPAGAQGHTDAEPYWAQRVAVADDRPATVKWARGSSGPETFLSSAAATDRSDPTDSTVAPSRWEGGD